MRNSIYKLFEYAYIAMAIGCVWLVYQNWADDRGQAYMFIFFGILAVVMFFFKRRFRKMIEKRNDEMNK